MILLYWSDSTHTDFTRSRCDFPCRQLRNLWKLGRARWWNIVSSLVKGEGGEREGVAIVFSEADGVSRSDIILYSIPESRLTRDQLLTQALLFCSPTNAYFINIFSLYSFILPRCSPLFFYYFLILPFYSLILPFNYFLLISYYYILISFNKSI